MAKINPDSEDNREWTGRMSDKGLDGTHLRTLFCCGAAVSFDGTLWGYRVERGSVTGQVGPHCGGMTIVPPHVLLHA
jgi:hypothetical protein